MKTTLLPPLPCYDVFVTLLVLLAMLDQSVLRFHKGFWDPAGNGFTVKPFIVPSQ